ncbi:MAG: PRC-barrel domain-containing protein [Candidatus Nanoarchaeia archaeon]|nr:PRC-barrel domain-containing protein [Candidatus Nanoarchaeia archaeon]
MLKVKNISDVYNMSVYTDDGSFFGIIEESVIADNKIAGWKIKSTKGSVLNKMLGGAKGVIVPHQLVKAMDNIVLISKAAIPTLEEENSEEE